MVPPTPPATFIKLVARCVMCGGKKRVSRFIGRSIYLLSLFPSVSLSRSRRLTTRGI